TTHRRPPRLSRSVRTTHRRPPRLSRSGGAIGQRRLGHLRIRAKHQPPQSHKGVTMKVIVVGTGFVGLTHAAVCSEYGHEVYAYDIDQRRLAAYRSAEREQIEQYVNEPGLTGIIAENIDRYLFFTDDLASVLEGTDAIFLCLPTPPNPDGSSDLSYYFNAVRYLSGLLAERKDTRRVVLINKSTVPIGTARQLERVLHECAVPNAGVASNPEFL